MPNDQDILKQEIIQAGETNAAFQVETIFDGELPCLLVYSEPPHVEYMYSLVSRIESVLREKGFRPQRLPDETSGPAGEQIIEKLLDNCILGIVITDGFRPEIPYNFGLLKGRKKPTILLQSKTPRSMSKHIIT
jgi:DNA-binding LacI/PurR family transcriptional regulator